MEFIRHKIIDLLNTFSQNDIRQFRKLTASPLYTRRRNYTPLLNAIEKIRHQYKDKIPPKELYSALYPGKNFNSQTLKNRLSELFRMAEEYVVYRKLNENFIEKEKLLLQDYLEKNLDKLFQPKYKKTRKIVESLPDNDQKFRNISFLNGINLSLLNKKNTVSRRNQQYYERSIYSLCTFLIEIFQEGTEFKILEYGNMKIKSNVVEEIIEQLPIEGLINKFKKSDVTIQKAVCMYYYLYKAFENPQAEHYYYEMKKIFSALINSFSNDYKDEIYRTIINYCILKQNEGIKKFQYELFNIYNEKLKQGLYYEFRRDSYPVNTFRDYVFIGMAIKKYKWVENFIRKYSPELPEDSRDDEMNLSYAKLYFAEKQFEKSMQYLNKIKGLNYLHYTDASVLKLCCHYEFNNIDDCLNELDKYRHYLKNHREIPEVHRVPNLNFMKVYQKLVTNKTRAIKSDLGFLKEEIVSMKFIAKGEWLLEKIRDV